MSEPGAAAPTHPKASRGRDIHEPHRTATPLELLFDLTFVIAVATAASQLHHAEGAGHTLTTLPGYAVAFFAIWWAWMNYTWFASAYDNDDVSYRVLTLLQMVGALVFATGVPGLFKGDTTLGVAGYVAMRLPLCLQWLRAAQGDPQRRATCLRYAGGVAFVQVLWIVRAAAVVGGWLPPGWAWPTLIALIVAELAVPPWAESRVTTPWHAHHIAERYSGFVIIILGESILGAANAIGNGVQASGLSAELALVGLGCTLLAFCLWWMYFLLPSGEALHRHRERAFFWGYGHYLSFAALAAVGSGLEVVADAMKTPPDTAAASAASSAVAIPLAIFIVSVWALHRHATRSSHRQLVLVLVVLACVGLAPLAVAQGLPLVWGLLLLSLGPLVSIVYNERGRTHCAADFVVR